MSSAWSAELALTGAGGEPVDLWRSIQSHGLVDLPPMRIDEEARSLEITVPLPGARPRTVQIAEGKKGRALVAVAGRTPGAHAADAVLVQPKHVRDGGEDSVRRAGAGGPAGDGDERAALLPVSYTHLTLPTN